MRPRNPVLLLTLLLALGCWLAPAAQARGGRFSPPAPRAPGSAADATGPSGAPEAGDAFCGQVPLPPPPPRVVPVPEPTLGGADLPGRATGSTGLGDVPEATGAAQGDGSAGEGAGDLGGARRRAARAGRVPGLDDWMYWYEVNREEYEDLRGTVYVTEGNPVFELGGALGPRAGHAERRLDPQQVAALKRAVRDVLVFGEDGHWVLTEGAAYVALGKIASTDEEVELVRRALLDHDRYTQYVRESAALGLGQLRRSDPRRQLPDTTLDQVRRDLERVLGDVRFAPRTRAFAALSLGLLADQPAVGGSAARATALHLFGAWMQDDLPDETQVGVLMGLGLVGPDAIGSLERLGLQACVLRGERKGRTCASLVRAQAAVALGRVGGAGDVPVLLSVLRDRNLGSPALRQAAVIAAGVLGARVPAARLALAEAALQAHELSKEPTAGRLGLMSAARLLAAQAAHGGADAQRAPRRAARLREVAAGGTPGDRGFAALALGVVARAVTETLDEPLWQRARGELVAQLRAGLADPRLDGHGRAAFATGLGLARDGSSAAALVTLVADADTDPELRAWAALALGLLGEVRQDVLLTVRAALVDARSDRLRMNAVTALGLLGGGGAKDREKTLEILLAELDRTRNQNVKGQIAITLARIGDARAVRPLIGVLTAPKEPHLNRSMACAALGLLGDEERTPVLGAARRDAHYTGGSSVVFEVLDVL